MLERVQCLRDQSLAGPENTTMPPYYSSIGPIVQRRSMMCSRRLSSDTPQLYQWHSLRYMQDLGKESTPGVANFFLET